MFSFRKRKKGYQYDFKSNTSKYNRRSLKTISRADLCIMDIEGKVLVSTFAEQVASSAEVLSFVESQADSQVIKGFQYFKVYDEHQLEYVLIAGGGSEDIYMIGKLAAFQIENLLIAYKERFDKR